MHVEEPDSFTAWLTKELRPLCDAEPASLAKYAMALIRKPDRTPEEIHQFCLAQLEIFLQGNTKMFVDRMFAVLNDKSYLPKKAELPEAPKKAQAEIPKKDEKKERKEEKKSETKPAASSSRDIRSERESETRKRPAPAPVKKEEPPKKEPAVSSTAKERPLRKRISPPPPDNKALASRDKDRELAGRRRSRSPRNRRDRPRRSPEHPRNRHVRRSRSRSADRDRRERKSDEERKKRRCRDFDEKGFCMRGDMCQFDHGPDPVVVDHESAIEKMVKGQPAPNFSIPPPGYNPVNPATTAAAAVDVYAAGGSSVEGYNPEAPALSSANFTVPPPPLPMHINNSQWRATSYNAPMQVGYDPSAGIPVDPSSASAGAVAPLRGMRGRGRGGFVHHGGRLPITKGDGKTIMVKKIPVEQNTITKLNEHFAQFGNIDNIQVRFKGDPETALITFASRMEAINAIKSPSPVLNNRFIKVVWYNPDEDSENGVGLPSGGVRRLNSGVSVEKPAPPKIASVREAKFVNKAVIEERAKRKQAKHKIKELQEARKAVVSKRDIQQVVFDKSISNQKTVINMLRECEKLKKEEQRKRLAEMSKTNLGRIGESKALIAELNQQIAKIDEEIAQQAKIMTARPTQEVDEGRNSESPELNEVSVSVVETKDVGRIHQQEEYDRSDGIIVRGFKADDEHRVTEIMEQYGDLLDVELQSGDSENVSAVYKYKDSADAESAVLQGVQLDGRHLKVQWQEPRPKDIIIHVSSDSDDKSVRLD